MTSPSKLLLEQPGDAALRADAEQLAEAYDFDVSRLAFEYDRRSFGSFTTTVAGSPAQRDRYFRALQFAMKRERVAGLMQAAE